MDTKPILSLTLLLAASASVFFANGAAATDLARDHKPHQACVERVETVSRQEGLPLKVMPTHASPQTNTGHYHYYFNATVRAQHTRHYRLECKANRVGRVTYFALEPGRWVYEAPDTRYLAAR
jgi:hypothetical protein